MKMFIRISVTILFCMIWGSLQRGCQDATRNNSGTGYLIGNIVGLGLLVAGIYGIWKIKFNYDDKDVPATTNPSSHNIKTEPVRQYQYQPASNIFLIKNGGYILKSNSNYYNLLIFEFGGTCKKANIHKAQEVSPGGVIFLTLLNSCFNLPGNKGFWSYNEQKNEVLIKFNLDREHEQTFRCKLRVDGTLVANVFYQEEGSQDMKKDVREYYFDSNFKDRFLI